MKNEDSIYIFEYPFSMNVFLNNIPETPSYYDDKYLIKKVNGMLYVGVERLGHSGGRWFVGKLSEKDGKTLIIDLLLMHKIIHIDMTSSLKSIE